MLHFHTNALFFRLGTAHRPFVTVSYFRPRRNNPHLVLEFCWRDALSYERVFGSVLRIDLLSKFHTFARDVVLFRTSCKHFAGVMYFHTNAFLAWYSASIFCRCFTLSPGQSA